MAVCPHSQALACSAQCGPLHVLRASATETVAGSNVELPYTLGHPCAAYFSRQRTATRLTSGATVSLAMPMRDRKRPSPVALGARDCPRCRGPSASACSGAAPPAAAASLCGAAACATDAWRLGGGFGAASLGTTGRPDCKGMTHLGQHSQPLCSGICKMGTT